MELGAGVGCRSDNFFIRAECGFALDSYGRNMVMAISSRVIPGITFAGEDSILGFALGFPVSYSYSGDGFSVSAGLAISMEVGRFLT